MKQPIDTKEPDEAMTLSNPRIIAAAYFGVLAIIFTILVDTLLYALGVEEFLPLYEAIPLAVVVAAVFGAMFGERIVHSKRPYRMHTFFLAFFMVLIALPIYNIGFLYLFKANHADVFAHATFQHFFIMYLFILVYSLVIAGIWIAILAGLAALFLRGYLVYYLLHSLYHRGRHVIQPAPIPHKNKSTRL